MTVDLSLYEISQITHPVWGKLPALLEAFERYPDAEWVWWLDIHAIIMTPTIDLYQHILSPRILESKLVVGEPILVLDENFNPIESGLRTSVSGGYTFSGPRSFWAW